VSEDARDDERAGILHELPEEAPGAADPELEAVAAAELTLEHELLLFAMSRHQLVAAADDADDRPGPGSRTLLVEPPSSSYRELSDLGLIEIEDASRPGERQWLVMLTEGGQLRAHRVAEQRLVRESELNDEPDEPS
jgi:hypothetical protein